MAATGRAWERLVEVRSLALIALAGCAHPVAAPATPIGHAPAPPPVAAAPAKVRWPVPVRVMAWTDVGKVKLGDLPDHPPATMPPGQPWFVEAVVAPADRATFDALIAEVRDEHVPGLSLAGAPVAAWLEDVHDLPDLGALVLSDTDVDGAALAKARVALTRLYLARTAIDDAAIARVAIAQPRLEVLDVEDCRIADAGARAISTLAALHAVNLAGTAIDDAGGAELGALANLAIVDLGRTRVADRTIAALAALPLEQIFLDATLATAPAIAKLAPIAPTARRVDVSQLASGAKPTDAQLAWLATAPNLVEASLSGAAIHDALVGKLVAIASLRELRIARAPITLTGARAVAARAELEVVDLGDTVADDPVAAGVLAHPNLRFARFDRDPIGDAALLRGPLPPSLVELYLTKTKVTDAGLAVLDALPQLEGLGLGDTAIGDPTLARIATLVHLTTLVLTNVRPKTSDQFLGLAALRDLERLYLADARIDDRVLAAIAPLHRLRALHVSGADLSDAALPALRGFHALEELAIGDTAVTDEIADLAAWPRLHTLSLLGLGITDRELPALAKGARLQVLDLSSTRVTDPAPLAALTHLQTLGLETTKLSPDGVASAKRLAARGVNVVR